MSKINFLTVKANATLSAINENFNRIKQELQDKVLYRNNPVGEPNTLENDVDANGNKIFNLESLSTQELIIDGAPVTGDDLENFLTAINTTLRIPSGTISPISGSRAGKFITFDIDEQPLLTGGTGNDPTLRSDLLASNGSTNVAYTQAGTGAVTRTLQDRTREVLSVKDFGAVGNGVADDTIAINNAVVYAQSLGGGIVFFPAGTYKTTGTINITASGVKLYGLAAGSGVEGYIGAPAQPAVTIKTTATVGINITGPISGWGIENIGVVFDGVISNSVGIQNNGGYYGDCRNVYVSGAKLFSIIDAPTTSSAIQRNMWNGVYISMPNDPAATGIKIGGTVAGTFRIGDTWTNVLIVPSNVAQTAMLFSGAAGIVLTNVEIKSFGCKGLVFDYNADPGRPNNINFYNLEVYDNTITNVGTPAAGLSEIKVFGFSTNNGATYPRIRNFRIMDVPFFSRTKFYSSNAQSIGNASTLVNLDAIEFDTDSLANGVTHRITPIRAGLYKVTAQVQAASGPAGSVIIATIQKNASTPVAVGVTLNSGNLASAFTTGYVSMNGTTDFINLNAQVTGGSTAINTGSPTTWLLLEGPV